MLPPPVPENEVERMRVLNALHILDSKREDVFDELALTAALVASVPISAITFVDQEREWFKACHGVDLDHADRQIAFCAHAINEPGEILVVEDALRDGRFAENPLVRDDPHIRFYVGVPLVVDHVALGALCVIDHVPRRLAPDVLAALRGLGRVTERVIAMRRVTEANHPG